MNSYTINIPKELEIPLSKVKNALKKYPGDMVAVGDTIAVKKNFFGRQDAAIVSKIEGKVVRYERITGNLVIAASDASLTENIISPVDGTIALCDNEQIVIQTDQDAPQQEELHESGEATFSSHERSEGEIFVLEQSLSDTDSEGALFHLDSEAIGKIIVGGNFSKELLVKGISIGVVGIVGTDIREIDRAYLRERNMKVPVMTVDRKTIEKLVKWNGKKVVLDAGAKTVKLVD